MNTRDMSSETKTFIPSARRALLLGAVIGIIASVVLIFFFWAEGGLKGHPENLIILICLLPLIFVLVYLRFCLGISAKIEISQAGITNTTRSGKTCLIRWGKVTSVNHKRWHQESFTIKDLTEHRIHFTEAGLSGSEWQEICRLIEHYTADKR